MTDEKETPKPAAAAPGSSKEEVALELMKFISGTTGLGKSSSGAGFGGKSPRTPEENAEVLIQLYEKCRSVVSKG
jgi:hypothetical protein